MNDPAVQGHMQPYLILPLHVPFTLAFKYQPASQSKEGK